MDKLLRMLLAVGPPVVVPTGIFVFISITLMHRPTHEVIYDSLLAGASIAVHIGASRLMRSR
ncbi:MAG: hypothetical protein ACKVZJ_15740 [Phycisphaerales bacterium]